MAIDPKKDPSRRCRSVEEWPMSDRAAWAAAIEKSDILDPGGAGADWAPHSQRKHAKGYGRYLTWLDIHRLLDPDVPPSARITPDRVRDYVEDLRLINAPYSVLARVQELYHAIRVMVPERDWSWLLTIENNVRHKAVSVRRKRSKIVPVSELCDLGVELMTTADDPASGSPLRRAAQYRDGLMIALLAARPLRRRNFAEIEIGRHLVRRGEAFWLWFTGPETKSGKLIDQPLPQLLVPYLERYLAEYRPLLLARDGRWKRYASPAREPDDALWISTHGSAMTEMAIYCRICTLTLERFGHGINPHLFRDSAATSVAIEDPEHVHIVPSVLGHSSLRTSEQHYIHAQSLEASRRYQQMILKMRRESKRRFRQ